MSTIFFFIRTLLIALLILVVSTTFAQDDKDALYIKKIYDTSLEAGKSYKWLTHLSEEIGGRLAGSSNAQKAIEYTKMELEQYADTVYLQPCTVPYWTRGRREKVRITNMPGGASMDLGGLALGNSVGTGKEGIQAEVVEVTTLDEVRELSYDGIGGKIVFFNRPMDPTQINTFYAYGGAADQRVNGPAVAAEFGAVGVVVRSLTTSIDDVPHTGVTRYAEGGRQIPAVAISTKDANTLHRFIQQHPVQLYIETHCKMVDPAKGSFNVIAEVKGSTHPDEIILVGGHLDSWDVGGGAHDDGAGCVHSMQVLQILQQLRYRPNRTLRCVLFMNEENGLGGGLAYAAQSDSLDEYHMAAIESDAGGFTPRGFTCTAEDYAFANFFRQITAWETLLEPLDLFLKKGGSGADITPLKSQGGLLMGLRPDSQRYFDYHHTENDRIQAVNERELKLGGAAMTTMVYLLDKFGLAKEADE